MTRSVLAVDDVSGLRKAISAVLTHAGYDVTEAGDGRDGLAKAAQAHFDLVLTDLYMPEMDGISMAREIHKLPNQAGVPIIFMTSETDEYRKEQARDVGATGWLIKPFLFDQLLRVAESALTH